MGTLAKAFSGFTSIYYHQNTSLNFWRSAGVGALLLESGLTILHMNTHLGAPLVAAGLLCEGYSLGSLGISFFKGTRHPHAVSRLLHFQRPKPATVRFTNDFHLWRSGVLAGFLIKGGLRALPLSPVAAYPFLAAGTALGVHALWRLSRTTLCAPPQGFVQPPQPPQHALRGNAGSAVPSAPR